MCAAAAAAAPPPLVSRPVWSLFRPGSQAELCTTLREPDSCLMVRRRAPRELERYVFRPGGRSDRRVHAGGEEGLPEGAGPQVGGASPGKDDEDDDVVDVVKAIMKDSGGRETEARA